jgi:2-polyprenyl-3-methyl-5-hydroxy-6-metoxy-1,4-benzoquinol methylase
MKCRSCYEKLEHVFIDLVNAPPSNDYLSFEQLSEPEVFYPLKVYVCHNCFLVQVEEYKKSHEIFSKEYLYFSSFSSSWLEHSSRYTDMIIKRFGINIKSKVIEIASNDGYLLQYFVKKGIPVLGIEPATATAEIAIQKGIETITEFFDVSMADYLKNKGIQSDLLIGNNVLAHGPKINDFVRAMKINLKSTGVITMEFPHLMQLVENNQFDTIYHEHYSYLSFTAVKRIFDLNGLTIFDVEEIPTHGGSLRIYVKHEEDSSKEILASVSKLMEKENIKGMKTLEYYSEFQKSSNKIKYDFLDFLLEQKMNGKKVAAYGAAAKGNTLLNYCGIKKDLISFVVDKSPYKQGKFLPASHIPVVEESFIRENKPDYIVILPWNIKDEIIEQLSYIREWGAKFVVAIPKLEII